MKPVRYDPEAFEDIRATVRYYESQDKGLGLRFRVAIDVRENEIRLSPKLNAIYDDTPCRICQVHKFPYAICYLEYDDYIRIVGIIDLRRKPGYWLRRLR